MTYEHISTYTNASHCLITHRHVHTYVYEYTFWERENKKKREKETYTSFSSFIRLRDFKHIDSSCQGLIVYDFKDCLQYLTSTTKLSLEHNYGFIFF